MPAHKQTAGVMSMHVNVTTQGMREVFEIVLMCLSLCPILSIHSTRTPRKPYGFRPTASTSVLWKKSRRSPAGIQVSVAAVSSSQARARRTTAEMGEGERFRDDLSPLCRERAHRGADTVAYSPLLKWFRFAVNDKFRVSLRRPERRSNPPSHISRRTYASVRDVFELQHLCGEVFLRLSLPEEIKEIVGRYPPELLFPNVPGNAPATHHNHPISALRCL